MKTKKKVLILVFLIIIINAGFYSLNLYVENDEKRVSNIEKDFDSDTLNEIKEDKVEEFDTDKDNSQNSGKIVEVEETIENNEVEKSNINESTIFKEKPSINNSVVNESDNKSNIIIKDEEKQDYKNKKDTIVNQGATEDKEDENIININDIFYSIHKGRIEYDSLEKCNASGTELALENTEEINYFNCVEIYSTTEKFLGVYLDIICTSGDCNRFKN